MRITGFTIAITLAGLYLPGAGWAQGWVEPTVRQPASIRQASLPYDQAVPEDPGVGGLAWTGGGAAPELGQAGPAQPAPQQAGPTIEYGPGPEIADPADPPAPWKMPQPCLLQNLGIGVGGWIQQGITFNADRPADRFNGPVTTNDRDREYQLNQAWLYFMRPTKTDGCGWDLGGRIDVVYGTDWRYGQSFGLENRIDSPDRFYGLILPQFYAEVAVNNLTVKLGHFATFTSYEVIPPVLNFFYSHSYLMAGYFDPLLATGAQGEYKLGDNWTVIGGVNRGWLKFEDPIDTLHFLGGVKRTSDDKRTNLSVMIDTGRENGFTGEHQRDSVFTVLTHKFNDRLAYGSQYTVGREVGGSFVEPGDDAQWFGTEQVLIYTLSPKWSAGLRYEWVRDQDGSRIAGIGNVLLTDKGWGGLPGFTGSFHDLSFGLNYRPHPNFVLRPEIRWDWYAGRPNPFGQLPFDDFTRRQQLLFAVDLLTTF